MVPDTTFQAPTSVILVGNDRTLLNWVAYALAVQSDPAFIWTDLRLLDQPPEPDDPMARGVIPSDQLRVRHPTELTLDHSTANVAVSAVVRSDEPPENVRRLLDFLRLPRPTQAVLSERHGSSRLPVLVLSNSHRMAALYPSPDDVRSTVRTILDQGVVLIMSFADAAPAGRVVFDNVVLVDGSVRAGWRQASLRVEKGSADGPFRSGQEFRLGEFEPLASVLARTLG